MATKKKSKSQLKREAVMNGENLTPAPDEVRLVKGSSPVPAKKIILMNFFDAIREAMIGKKLTRIAWDNVNTYMFKQDEYLSIQLSDCAKDECKKGCKGHAMLTSTGDIEGIDWYVLPDTN